MQIHSRVCLQTFFGVSHQILLWHPYALCICRAIYIYAHNHVQIHSRVCLQTFFGVSHQVLLWHPYARDIARDCDQKGLLEWFTCPPAKIMCAVQIWLMCLLALKNGTLHNSNRVISYILVIETPICVIKWLLWNIQGIIDHACAFYGFHTHVICM